MADKLKEMQERLYAKQDLLKGIFDEARLPDESYDFLKAAAFKTLSDQQACLDKIHEIEEEQAALHAEVKALETIRAAENRNLEHIRERELIDDPMVHAVEKSNGHFRTSYKSLGQLVFDAWPKEGRMPA